MDEKLKKAIKKRVEAIENIQPFNDIDIENGDFVFREHFADLMMDSIMAFKDVQITAAKNKKIEMLCLKVNGNIFDGVIGELGKTIVSTASLSDCVKIDYYIYFLKKRLKQELKTIIMVMVDFKEDEYDAVLEELLQEGVTLEQSSSNIMNCSILKKD